VHAEYKKRAATVNLFPSYTLCLRFTAALIDHDVIMGSYAHLVLETTEEGGSLAEVMKGITRITMKHWSAMGPPKA
jgi:hypothetical protein